MGSGEWELNNSFEDRCCIIGSCTCKELSLSLSLKIKLLVKTLIASCDFFSLKYQMMLPCLG